MVIVCGVTAVSCTADQTLSRAARATMLEVASPLVNSTAPIGVSTIEKACDPSRDDRTSELCAAWKSADAAAAAAQYSFWQLVVAWIGAALGALTMSAAIAAAIYARRAAEAGEASAQTARDAAAGADEALSVARTSAAATSEAVKQAARSNEIMLAGQNRQLRPYIHFVKGTAKARITKPIGEDKTRYWLLDCDIELRNSGLTPASINRRAACVYTYIGDDNNLVWRQNWVSAEREVVGPGLAYAAGTGAHWAAMMPGTSGVGIIGFKLTYGEADQSWTEECWFWAPIDGNPSEEAISQYNPLSDTMQSKLDEVFSTDTETGPKSVLICSEAIRQEFA